MSAHLPTDELRKPPPPPSDREDSLRLLRQLLAEGARVVRLGGRMSRIEVPRGRRSPACDDVG